MHSASAATQRVSGEASRLVGELPTLSLGGERLEGKGSADRSSASSALCRAHRRPRLNRTSQAQVDMRLDTIVVGMDFSRQATGTTRWLSTTLAPRARLVLVHAIEPPGRPPFPIANTLPEPALAFDARAHATEQLREASTAIGRNIARTEIRFGRAHEVVLQVAAETGADMIAVGPHGTRAHESLLLGTTADSLVRSSGIPVLIGGRSPMRGRTDVVAAVTESPATTAVLGWADLAARRLDGRLTVLHAIEPAAYSHLASMAAAHAHGEPAVERAEVQGELRRQTLHWLRECANCGIDTTRVAPQVEEGPAAESIVRFAARERAALIVVGRHQTLRGLPAMLGRTVRHVLHEARCAILVVPDEGVRG